VTEGVCAFCGACAVHVYTCNDVEVYRCRSCGLDTSNELVETGVEFGMHLFDPLDDLDSAILTTDEELLKLFEA
jgi:hypothetical protein